MAQALATACQRDVEAIVVPRDQWETRFESEGMPAGRTAPRIAMLDGFNSGWIDFERTNTEHVQGSVRLGDVVEALVHPRNPQ